jgi:hypothetical protein
MFIISFESAFSVLCSDFIYLYSKTISVISCITSICRVRYNIGNTFKKIHLLKRHHHFLLPSFQTSKFIIDIPKLPIVIISYFTKPVDIFTEVFNLLHDRFKPPFILLTNPSILIHHNLHKSIYIHSLKFTM